MKKRNLANIVAVSVVLWALFGWAILNLLGYEIDYARAGQYTTVAVIALALIWASYAMGIYHRKDVEQRYAMPVHVVRTEEQKALAQEQTDFNARRDNPYLERARRAESLGFIDPDDAA